MTLIEAVPECWSVESPSAPTTCGWTSRVTCCGCRHSPAALLVVVVPVSPAEAPSVAVPVSLLAKHVPDAAPLQPAPLELLTEVVLLLVPSEPDLPAPHLPVLLMKTLSATYEGLPSMLLAQLQDTT